MVSRLSCTYASLSGRISEVLSLLTYCYYGALGRERSYLSHVKSYFCYASVVCGGTSVYQGATT